MTVHQLRHVGHKVRVTHRRRYFDPITKRWYMLAKWERMASPIPSFVQPDPCGGETAVEVRFDNSEVEISVTEKCNKKDQYVRQIGLDNALKKIVTIRESQLADTIAILIETPDYADLKNERTLEMEKFYGLKPSTARVPMPPIVQPRKINQSLPPNFRKTSVFDHWMKL